MSGHAHFQTIGGTMPQMPTNPPTVENQDISRSMAVGGVNALGAEGDVQNVQVRPLKSDGVEKSKALVRQLDVLLARAAESATKGVDANAVKTTLNHVNFDKGARKMVNDAADKADAAYKAINKFTGRDLARAVAVDDNGKFDWAKNPAGEAIKKALDAQAELSDLLRQVLTQIPGGATANTLEEALMQCDRRACEIQTLVCQFADILEKGEPNDPAVKQRLDQTLEKLLPRQALQMHGNAAALAAMKEHVAPLAKRLDALTNTHGVALSSEELAVIGREIDQMSNALDGAIKSGVAGKNGLGIDRTLFSAAKDILAEAKGKLSTVRQDVVKESMQNFIDKTFAPIPGKILDAKFLPILKAISPDLYNLVSTRSELRKAAHRYAKEPNKINYSVLKGAAEAYSKFGTTDNMKDIRDALELLSSWTLDARRHLNNEKNIVKGLIDAVNKSLSNSEKAPENLESIAKDFAKLLIDFSAEVLPAPSKSPTIYTVLSFIKPASGILSQTAHLKLMHKTAENMDDAAFLTSDTVRSAFEGKVRFTTVVEARLHGLKDDDVDPKLDDLNHVSSEKRGSGSVNSVYEVKYKDGSSYIFKPEAEGRQMISSMPVINGIKDKQMVAQLNIASQKTADALGLGDVMTKTTVGSHKDEFGIFMEKAKGVEAVEFVKTGKSERAPDGDLAIRDIKKLPDDEYAKIVGSLMRKCNRLDWFDMITGQGDRHVHNYMVSVDKETHEVSLKAIDNDACFPAFRTGIRKFHLDEAATKRFDNVMKLAAIKLYPGEMNVANARKVYRMLAKDGGVKFHNDGTATIDSTKFTSPIMHYCLFYSVGAHTDALPDYIDEELYNNLMALAEPGERRDQYIADMTANLPEDAKNAAIMRLDGAIAHARSLYAKKHVVATEAWNDHEKQKAIAGRLPPDSEKGEYEFFGNIGSNSKAGREGKAEIGIVIDHMKNGYFRRDLMLAIAKPDWFDK